MFTVNFAIIRCYMLSTCIFLFQFEDLRPYDVKLMVEPHTNDPDMILEGAHLGRGLEWTDKSEMRRYAVLTQVSNQSAFQF